MTFTLCSLSQSLSGNSASFLSIAAAIFLFISAAAAEVNVNTKSLSTETGFLVSQIIRIMRSTKTAVFPLPAAAATSMLQPCVSIAAVCSFVQFTDPAIKISLSAALTTLRSLINFYLKINIKYFFKIKNVFIYIYSSIIISHCFKFVNDLCGCSGGGSFFEIAVRENFLFVFKSKKTTHRRYILCIGFFVLFLINPQTSVLRGICHLCRARGQL